jgi:hypothetical protein
MDFFWQYFWWFFGAFGIAGLVAVFFLWPLVVGTKLGKILVAIGLGTLGVLAVLARTRQQGVEAERRRQEKENADFLEAQRRRNADIDKLSRDELERLLHDRDAEPPKDGG